MCFLLLPPPPPLVPREQNVDEAVCFITTSEMKAKGREMVVNLLQALSVRQEAAALVGVFSTTDQRAHRKRGNG